MWDLIVSVPDHCLSFYFEVEHNGRTTLKISFVMTRLLCVQFKMNLQIIILPKPLLHAWHLRGAKSVHRGNESIKR